MRSSQQRLDRFKRIFESNSDQSIWSTNAACPRKTGSHNLPKTPSQLSRLATVLTHTVQMHPTDAGGCSQLRHACYGCAHDLGNAAFSTRSAASLLP